MGFFFLRSDYAHVAYEALQKELHLERTDDFFSRTLSGHYEGAEITLRGDRGGRFEEVVVRTREGTPRDLFLFPADGASESAVPTFDAGFDRKVHVGGRRASVAAMFDEETRETIASIIWAHRAIFTHGAFMLDAQAAASINGGPLAGEIDGRRFARFLRRVVRLGQRLADRAAMPIPELLLENVLRDPRIDVRRHNLMLLTERFPETFEAQRGARSVLEHHQASLRLLGSLYFSRRDPPDLRPLDALYRDERVPLDAREAAFARILDVVSAEDRRALIREALESPLVKRAVAECRARGDPIPDDVLGRLLVAGSIDAIRYVADLGDRRHEPLLVRLLDGEDLGATYAAVEALARLGTAHAAEALNDLANGILTPARLRRAALLAIDAIRDRGGYEAGRLSLTDLEGDGGLSVIECGHVSMDE